MSPALIQLFAFMTGTFALGVFLGWALWRYGGVSAAALEDFESREKFWKESLDQSRSEVWELQQSLASHQGAIHDQDRPISRSRVSRAIASRSALPSTPGPSAKE